MGQSDILPLTHATYNAHLFKTSVFSDCTIQSGHRLWHLHRCILSPRCEFFWNCFQGCFEEASSAKVEMHDDDPETLGRLLEWIYTLDYPTSSDPQCLWTSHLDLYLMADKYGLTNLMELTRLALLQTASQCHRDPTYFRKTIDDFCEAVEILFVEFVEHPGLETLRKELIASLSHVLGSEMRKIPELSQLMVTVPDFGISLVESLAQCNKVPSTSSTRKSSPFGGSSYNSHSDSPSSSSPGKTYIPLNEDSEDDMS